MTIRQRRAPWPVCFLICACSTNVPPVGDGVLPRDAPPHGERSSLDGVPRTDLRRDTRGAADRLADSRGDQKSCVASAEICDGKDNNCDGKVDEGCLVGATYYVALTGKDTNPGTLAQPWRSLMASAYKLKPGDTLFIRGGTYGERLYVAPSGTATGPIKVSNYNGETVILDGNNHTLPAKSSGSGLIQVPGSYVIVSGLTTTKSGEYGAIVSGTHVILDSIYSHHNFGSGIILSGSHDTARSCKVWYNSMVNEGGGLSISWGTGISCARYPDHCTIEDTVSWENWGEGISTFETTNTTIQGCTSYNNMLNFYISDTRNTTLQRNLAYCTAGNIIKPTSGPNGHITTQTNIGVWDEIGVPLVNGIADPSGTRYPSAKNTIINNMAMGCDRPLAISPKVSTENLFAHNTLVNALPALDPATVYFYSGSCTSCRFVNNLVVQEGALPIAVNGGSGMTFSNNLWSKTPLAGVKGQQDVYLNGDALLVQQLLSRAGPSGAGTLTPGWFTLPAGSAAINKGMVLAEVGADLFGTPRGAQPDIGAVEHIP